MGKLTFDSAVKKVLLIIISIIFIGGLTVLSVFLVSKDNTKNTTGKTNTAVNLYYTNKALSLFFEYPKGYVIKEETLNLPTDNLINLIINKTDHSGDEIIVSIYQNPSQQPIEQYILDKANNGNILLLDLVMEKNFSLFEKKNVKINGIDAVIYQSKQAGQRNLIWKNGNMYVFVTEQTNYLHNEVFNLVLQSLRSSK